MKSIYPLLNKYEKSNFEAIRFVIEKLLSCVFMMKFVTLVIVDG